MQAMKRKVDAGKARISVADRPQDAQSGEQDMPDARLARDGATPPNTLGKRARAAESTGSHPSDDKDDSEPMIPPPPTPKRRRKGSYSTEPLKSPRQPLKKGTSPRRRSMAEAIRRGRKRSNAVCQAQRPNVQTKPIADDRIRAGRFTIECTSPERSRRARVCL
ncbi:hypothetical protein AAF712_004766 [Marasmius tenuissimus]|uniref:Uncharacterized protein n=1 Tax=Marasmius tenuissimus TaxID=585030 RepID=A0ABR3A292_9AGAR